MNNKLPNPEIEAEIYYLTEKEGGKKKPVYSGYRGQFHYNNKDWDAPQEFIDKEVCNPGESVKVWMQTLSPDCHVGQLFIGQNFEIREGARIVGRGKILKILRTDFYYWDFQSFLKTTAKNLNPKSGENLMQTINEINQKIREKDIVRKIEIKNTGQLDCMFEIACILSNNSFTTRALLIDNIKGILDKYNNLYKVQIDNKILGSNESVITYQLTFAIWDDSYVTGKIVF